MNEAHMPQRGVAWCLPIVTGKGEWAQKVWGGGLHQGVDAAEKAKRYGGGNYSAGEKQKRKNRKPSLQDTAEIGDSWARARAQRIVGVKLGKVFSLGEGWQPTWQERAWAKG